jgi:hypothetical protein
MGNSSQPTGAPRGTQRQTERAGEGFASVGVASYCAATYSPTRAPVRAGNSQQAQAFGEDRLWVATGRAGGRSAPKVTLLEWPPTIHPFALTAKKAVPCGYREEKALRH